MSNHEYSFAFDLEGTLVDLERFHVNAFEETAARYGVIFGEEEFRPFVGNGDLAISTEIARLLGEPGRVPEIRSAKRLYIQIW